MLTKKQIEAESKYETGATWANEQNATKVAALKSTIEEIYFLLCDGKTGAAKSLADTTLSKLEK